MLWFRRFNKLPGSYCHVTKKRANHNRARYAMNEETGRTMENLLYKTFKGAK